MSMGDRSLSRTIPQRMYTERFTWIVAFQVRSEAHDKIRPGQWLCGWCKRQFSMGERMFLAGRPKKTNMLLCEDHAREAGCDIEHAVRVNKLGTQD